MQEVSITAPGLLTPRYGLRVTASGGNVYAIDGARHTVTDTISVNSGPSGVAMNPTTQRVYVESENQPTF